MDSTMQISNAFAILFTGLVIVFCGLILLIVIVALMRNTQMKSMQNNVSTNSNQAIKVSSAPSIEEGISDEIVAVIAAAIASMTSSDGTTYAIRGIKKAKSSGRPIWAAAGLQENTRAF